MTRNSLFPRLIPILVAVCVACGGSETPAGAVKTSSAPAPTPDPRPPIAILDTPREGSTVPNRSWGTGWALDDSGILLVTATADTGAVSPAKIGQAFPGVQQQHPNMPDNDRAGFIFGLPDLPPGPHSVTVDVLAKDGGGTRIERRFIVQ